VLTVTCAELLLIDELLDALEDELDDRDEEEADDAEVELLFELDEVLELVLVAELETLLVVDEVALDDTDVDEDKLTGLFIVESTAAPPPEHAPSKTASDAHVADSTK